MYTILVLFLVPAWIGAMGNPPEQARGRAFLNPGGKRVRKWKNHQK